MPAKSNGANRVARVERIGCARRERVHADRVGIEHAGLRNVREVEAGERPVGAEIARELVVELNAVLADILGRSVVRAVRRKAGVDDPRTGCEIRRLVHEP